MFKGNQENNCDCNGESKEKIGRKQVGNSQGIHYVGHFGHGEVLVGLLKWTESQQIVLQKLVMWSDVHVSYKEVKAEEETQGQKQFMGKVMVV